MAGDTSSDGGSVSDRWPDSLARRLGIEHRHPIGTTVLVVVFAVGCGLYASWLLADLGLRWPALIVGCLGGGVLFYSQSTRRDVVAVGLYCLAGLLALTPVVLDLTFVLLSGAYDITPWPFVLTIADVVSLAVFAVPALLLSGIAAAIDR